MNTWVKVAAWGAVALVLFWIVLQIVGVILSVLSWVIEIVVTLAIVGIVLFGLYYVVSKLLGGSSSSGTSQGRERERLFE